jgi:hypothetical protein
MSNPAAPFLSGNTAVASRFVATLPRFGIPTS